MLIEHLLLGLTPSADTRIRPGFYLRGLSETFVAADRVVGRR
jgi:hypothetical protein